MTSMRYANTALLLGLWLGGFSACSTVLMSTPVSKKAEGWSVTLSQVKEGPNEYEGEVVTLASAPGEKLIWTLLTVQNEAGQEQTFSYEDCVLSGKDQSRKPEVVARHGGTNSAVDRAEAIEPGQARTRQLIFEYPKEQHPTRLTCGPIVLPIPKPPK
jgi:hypothetical protein